MNKGPVIVGVLMALCAISRADSEQVAESLGAMAEKGVETFEWGLLLEAEGFYSKAGSASESDVTLATVQFTAEAGVTDWLSGHVGLLWEEDDTEENILDEAFITVGGDYFARAGKFYLPFGNFQTAFISDPLTLELAEINRSSAMLGWNNEHIELSAGGFKGDNEDVVQCGYAAANLKLGDLAQAGVYFLTDLLETDGFADLNTNQANRVAGAGGYVNAEVGPVAVRAEVVAALESIGFSAGGNMTPVAYSVECACSAIHDWTVGLKVEGSDDFYTEYAAGLDGLFHEMGVGGVVSYGFHENAAVGVEYLRQMNKDAADADVVTVQLAFEI